MKKILSFYLKLLILLIITFIILIKTSIFVSVLGKTNNDNNQNPDHLTTLFYYLPKDSVDMLFIGDSHSFCTYINKQIYDELGVSSASLATSSNSVINQYWQVKEALKRQNIKYLIIDTHAFEIADDNRPSSIYLHFTSGISNIPDYSINKIMNYIDIKKHNYGIADSIKLNDVYNITRYKEDYDRDFDNLLSDIYNLIFNPSKLYKTFGFYPTTGVFNNSNIETYENNSVYVDYKNTLEYEYLIKILDLCKENEITVIFSRAIYDNKHDLHFFNEQLDEIAKENRINIVDYFNLIEECDFNLETDFLDSQHFNYLGAEKATKYFIEYFKENYKYIDHRGDSKYELWEKNSFDYNRIKGETLKNANK